MVFTDEFIADESQIRSVLDYAVEIRKLPESKQNYVAITGNYSVAGFELTLRRKVSHYIITCYLPSGDPLTLMLRRKHNLPAHFSKGYFSMKKGVWRSEIS